MMSDPRDQWLEEYNNDQKNPVEENITVRYFVSKSKGRRNGKQRLRRNWKEITLLKYMGDRFRQWHNFPFDVYADEILGDGYDGEDLKERI